MLTNVQKFPIPENGEENEKVIGNPHADTDHIQMLTTSRGSPLAHAYQVGSMSISASSAILFTE